MLFLPAMLLLGSFAAQATIEGDSHVLASRKLVGKGLSMLKSKKTKKPKLKKIKKLRNKIWKKKNAESDPNAEPTGSELPIDPYGAPDYPTEPPNDSSIDQGLISNESPVTEIPSNAENIPKKGRKLSSNDQSSGQVDNQAAERSNDAIEETAPTNTKKTYRKATRKNKQTTRAGFLDMATGKNADGSAYEKGSFSRTVFTNAAKAVTPSRALLEDGVSAITGRNADGSMYKEGDLIKNAADRSVDSIFGKPEDPSLSTTTPGQLGNQNDPPGQQQGQYGPPGQQGQYGPPVQQQGQIDQQGQQQGQYGSPGQQQGQYVTPGQQQGQYGPLGQTSQYGPPVQQQGQIDQPGQQQGQYGSPGQQQGQYGIPGQQQGQYGSLGQQQGQIDQPGQYGPPGQTIQYGPPEQLGQYGPPVQQHIQIDQPGQQQGQYSSSEQHQDQYGPPGQQAQYVQQQRQYGSVLQQQGQYGPPVQQEGQSGTPPGQQYGQDQGQSGQHQSQYGSVLQQQGQYGPPVQQEGQSGTPPGQQYGQDQGQSGQQGSPQVQSVLFGQDQGHLSSPGKNQNQYGLDQSQIVPPGQVGPQGQGQLTSYGQNQGQYGQEQGPYAPPGGQVLPSGQELSRMGIESQSGQAQSQSGSPLLQTSFGQDQSHLRQDQDPGPYNGHLGRPGQDQGPFASTGQNLEQAKPIGQDSIPGQPNSVLQSNTVGQNQPPINTLQQVGNIQSYIGGSGQLQQPQIAVIQHTGQPYNLQDPASTHDRLLGNQGLPQAISSPIVSIEPSVPPATTNVHPIQSQLAPVVPLEKPELVFQEELPAIVVPDPVLPVTDALPNNPDSLLSTAYNTAEVNQEIATAAPGALEAAEKVLVNDLASINSPVIEPKNDRSKIDYMEKVLKNERERPDFYESMHQTPIHSGFALPHSTPNQPQPQMIVIPRFIEGGFVKPPGTTSADLRKMIEILREMQPQYGDVDEQLEIIINYTSVAPDELRGKLNGISQPIDGVCWPQNYQRGAGVAPSVCPDNTQTTASFCYPHCRDGFKGTGSVCWGSCGNSDLEDGSICRRRTPQYIYAKQNYVRPVITSPACPDSKILHQGLCYEPCLSNYSAFGNMCWKKCEGSYSYQCGAGCAIDHDSCSSHLIPEFDTRLAKFTANLAAISSTFMTGIPRSLAAFSLNSTEEKIAKLQLGRLIARRLVVLADFMPGNSTNTNMHPFNPDIVGGAAKAHESDLDSISKLTAEAFYASATGESVDWVSRVPLIGIMAFLQEFDKPSCHNVEKLGKEVISKVKITDVALDAEINYVAPLPTLQDQIVSVVTPVLVAKHHPNLVNKKRI